MLRLKRHSSIHQIKEEHWNSILNSDDIFHTHQFIRAVEDSKVEEASFRYLLFYEGEQVVASTVLSAFKIDPLLFVNNYWLIKQLTKGIPHLFKTKILVCGLPASLGQQNLKLKDTKYAKQVCILLAEEMTSLAKELNIKFFVIKEFKQKELLLFTPLRHLGFFAAQSLPYMKMEIRWQRFDSYLSSLRHHYRRQVLLSLKKIGHTKPVILSPQEYNNSSSQPAWVLYNADESSADEFYQRYLNVMQRAATRLETLNRKFFHHLFQPGSPYKILSLVVKGKAISSALLLPAGDTLTFVLVGREEKKDAYDSYFNLLYGILAYAIEGNYQTLHLGQTAYWTKQCMGAEAENQYIWFGSTNKLWHWVFKKLNPCLFPETKLKTTNVFKKTRNTHAVLRAIKSAENAYDASTMKQGGHYYQKVVVITGGSSGIGLAVARELAVQGARLVIIGRNKEKLDTAKVILHKITNRQSSVLAIPADVSDKSQIFLAIQHAGEQFGRIDILINCAGIITCGRFATQPAEDLEQCIAINYMGAVYASKAAWPWLKITKGHLSFVSSVAGYIGLIGHSSYAPTKFALTGLAECLRMEGQEDGIHVSIIYPPDTETSLLHYERQHAPPETIALSKTVKTMKAEKVATIYLHGIEQNKFAIYCTSSSRLIRWFKQTFSSLFYLIASHISNRAAKRSNGGGN